MEQFMIVKKFLKVNRRNIAFIKYLFEGYEGLATVSTIDKSNSIIQISIMPDFIADTEKILDAVRHEVAFEEVPTYETERTGDENIL